MILPSLIEDLGFGGHCYQCGAMLAGVQTHYDWQGKMFCGVCGSIPRCDSCEELPLECTCRLDLPVVGGDWSKFIGYSVTLVCNSVIL